jgi:hypothetical protein
MKSIEYIYPIIGEDRSPLLKNHITQKAVIGNGFFVDNFFITAEHVKNIKSSTKYILVDGREYYLNNLLNLPYKSLTYDKEGMPYGHEDIDSTDIAVYLFDNLEINSPLRLSDSLPERGQHLHCDFYHSIKDKSLTSQISEIVSSLNLYFWETSGVVESEDKYFVGNFFGARMTPAHPNRGSSGSPLYDGNIVYGILHNGEENLCGFYSAAHALKLLRENSLLSR